MIVKYTIEIFEIVPQFKCIHICQPISQDEGLGGERCEQFDP